MAIHVNRHKFIVGIRMESIKILFNLPRRTAMLRLLPTKELRGCSPEKDQRLISLRVELSSDVFLRVRESKISLELLPSNIHLQRAEAASSQPHRSINSQLFKQLKGQNRYSAFPSLTKKTQKKAQIQITCQSWSDQYTMRCPKCHHDCQIFMAAEKCIKDYSALLCFLRIMSILQKQCGQVPLQKAATYKIGCYSCHWEGILPLFLSSIRRQSTKQLMLRKILSFISTKISEPSNQLSEKMKMLTKQLKESEQICEDANYFELMLRRFQKNEQTIPKATYCKKKQNTEPSNFSTLRPHQIHIEERKTLGQMQHRSHTNRNYYQYPNVTQQIRQRKTSSIQLQNYIKTQPLNHGRANLVLNPKDLNSGHIKNQIFQQAHQRKSSSQKKKKSFDLFTNAKNSSYNSLNCKRLSTVSKKQKATFNKLKSMKQRMQNGQLLLLPARRQAKPIVWDQIEKIRMEMLMGMGPNDQEEREESVISPIKHDSCLNNESQNNQPAVQQECKPEQLTDKGQLFWREVKDRFQNNINPIGQAIPDIKALLQDHGQKHLIPIYLLYKKFFYLRTAIYWCIQEDPQSLSTLDLQPCSWKQILTGPQYENNLAVIKDQNNKILQTLEKLSKRVRQKSSSSPIYDIVIQDDSIYEDFVKQLVDVNVDKYLTIYRKLNIEQKWKQKDEILRLWRYGHAIKMTILDDIQIEKNDGVCKAKQSSELVWNDIQVQMKGLQSIREGLMQ